MQYVAMGTPSGVTSADDVSGRRTVEGLLSHGPATTELNPTTRNQMRVTTDLPKYTTENANLVVEIPTEPAHLVALGYDLSTGTQEAG